MAPPHVDRIREYLDAPLSDRSESAQSLWEMAATALKRLVSRSPAAAKAPTSPPPIRARRPSAGTDAEPADSPAPIDAAPTGALKPSSSADPVQAKTSPPPLRRGSPPAGKAPQFEPTIELSGTALLPLTPKEEAAFTRAMQSDSAPREAASKQQSKKGASKGAKRKRAATGDAPDAPKPTAPPRGAGKAEPLPKLKPKWKSRKHRKSRQKKS